jgi:putative transposase
VLYEYRARGIFRLHEFVVMPDHFHLLMTVECGMTIEKAVQFIRGGFAFVREGVWNESSVLAEGLL